MPREAEVLSTELSNGFEAVRMMFWSCFLLLFATSSALFDVEEITNINYGIDILDIPVKAEQDPSEEQGQVFLTSKYGQQYQCSYFDKSMEQNLKEKEEEKVAMETGIVDLLKSMEGGACLTLTKGWWTYEFCYGKDIKQYHVEDGAILGNIIYLGSYQSDYDWSNTTHTKKKAWVPRYHTQEYVNGTDCDLTNQKRKTEVRFFCERSQGDYISRVDETETCVYTLTIQTPRICSHPYLKPPAKTKAVPITCQPLLTDEEYAEYQQVKAEEVERRALLIEQMAMESGSPGGLLPKEEGAATLLGDVDEVVEMTVEADEAMDTTTDKLQELITESLVSGLKEAFGAADDITVTEVKSQKIKPEDIDAIVKDLVAKANMEEEDGDLATEDAPIEEEEEETDGVVSDDEEEKDEDGLNDDDDDDEYDDDKALMEEFNKGLDEISDGQLKELNEYKETLQQEMNAQFAQIIREAEDELNDAGFREEVNKDAALKAMSDTLEKLLKQLEQKQMTSNSKEISSMIEKAAAETRFKVGLPSKPTKRTDDTDSEEYGEDTEEEQSMYDRKRDDDEEEDADEGSIERGGTEEEEDEDYVSLEYKIGYGDKQPGGDSNIVQSQPRPNEATAPPPTQSSTHQSRDYSAKSKSKNLKSYVKNYDYQRKYVPEEHKDSASGEETDTEISPDGKSETTHFKDNNVEIKVTSRYLDNSKTKIKEIKVESQIVDDYDPETQSPAELRPSSEEPGRGSTELGEGSVEVTDSKDKRRSYDGRKVQELVQTTLKKAGVKLPDQKIQVKIFTSEEYYNEGAGAKELLETGGVLNKMLVAVLGGNTEEIREAEKQDRLENNYGFVWGKNKKKSTAAPIED